MKGGEQRKRDAVGSAETAAVAGSASAVGLARNLSEAPWHARFKMETAL